MAFSRRVKSDELYDARFATTKIGRTAWQLGYRFPKVPVKGYNWDVLCALAVPKVSKSQFICLLSYFYDEITFAHRPVLNYIEDTQLYNCCLISQYLTFTDHTGCYTNAAD